jgi:broad specificity phosphatase PhoE
MYRRTTMSFRLARSKFTFEAQPNFFQYTNPAIDNDSLPAIAPNFGLESSTTWKALTEHIKSLNAKSSQTKEHYKLIYAARHGEGSHNVAEAKFGTKAWDDHWSLLTGDGTSIWGPDPHLTPVGEGQAREACSIWKSLLADGRDPPPLPTMFYSSPMIRSAKTLELTFEGILTKEEGFTPTILECIREDFKDRHSCDERSSRTEISKEWQGKGWNVDASVEEEDVLFKSDYKESREVMTQRLQDALSLIFDRSQGHDVINITSHSGAMQALFRAVQHNDFKPKTGGMVPLLVKATEKA